MRVSLVRFLIPVTMLTVILGLGCTGQPAYTSEPAGGAKGLNLFNVAFSMNTGQVQLIGARALYPMGQKWDVTLLADWSSSNSSIIEIVKKGMLRAKSGGKVTITASYKGVMKSVEITVFGQPLPPGPGPTVLSEIKVEPASATVKIEDSLQFKATAIFSNGGTQVVTDLVAWHVSNDHFGFIVNSENANVWGPKYGLFRGTSLGTTVVSCDYQGTVSNYVTVVVRDY